MFCNVFSGGGKVNIDPELRAMITVYEALKDLDDEAKVRVIEWVSGKFQLEHGKGFYPENRCFVTSTYIYVAISGDVHR